MPLTQRQQEILTFVETQDPAPTAREIAAHFQLSLGTIVGHIEALRAKGYLAAGDRHARSLRPANSFRAHQSPVLHLPLYGTIPAGFADLRHQEAESCISIDAQTLGVRPSGRLFALRVKGDSMLGRHILHGDIAILESGREPKTGDTVAALIDGESTLKIYHHNRGRPFLRAANENYPDLFPAAELKIQGVLLAVLRRVKG